ncbi:MAG: hypothetical protein DRI71_05660, partial [Bacteroidetes bacterium]
SATNSITFQSASSNNADVILTFASSDANANYTLQFDGADYIIFKDLTIKSAGAVYAKVIEMISGAAFNTIDNCIIQGVANIDNLVYVSSVSDNNISNIFVNNVFEDGQIGLRYLGASSTPGVEVRLNQFRNQTVKAMYISYCYEPVIDGNEISSNQPIDGIFIQDTGIQKARISNNKILLSSGGNGIVFEFELTGPSHTAEESLIYNNFIYINTATTASYGINVTPMRILAKIYHNTIHISGNSTGSLAYREYDLSSWSLDLKNNIMVNEAYGALFGGGKYANTDYNILYTNGEYIGYSARTLEDWQTTYNKGEHSIFANPYFVGSTSWQVQNSLVNGAALSVAEVTTDIDGESRDAVNPDIGADEFTPAPVPLNGTYTIGGTSPDYLALNKAVEDVVINGVGGPVLFNIADGTYNEQLTIQEIAGASATNNITFQSASEDSTAVIITNTPVNRTHTYTIQLNGADYLILKNLSVNSGEEWGIPIELKNEATNNQIEGNYIYKDDQAPFSWEYALVYAIGSADSSNVFSGNYFENGNIGIHLNGGGSGTEIRDNRFVNMFFQGIYLKNNLSPQVIGNTIDIATSSGFAYGIYLESATYDGLNKGVIANNMINMNSTSGGTTGISTPANSYLSVAFNTIKINSGQAYKGGSQTEILNNIFTSYGGSYVAEISDTTGCGIDYNLYYHPTGNNADMYYSAGYTTNLEQYGFDLHSFSREPKFISDTDLHTVDPWISNRGTALTEVTIDIDGDIRDLTTPDVGADEYIAATLFAGEYTIGPTGDFTTFTEAADSIAKTGANGPVIFKVQSGTYEEQFTLQEFPYAGVGDSITVTFKPLVAGDSTVILQYAGTSTDNYVVHLDSADYISFEGIRFKALDAFYSNIIYLEHVATHNTFADNIFIGSSDSGSIIYAIGNTNNNDNHFTDNRFYKGNIAISLEGMSDSNQATGLIIEGNYFEGQSTAAMVLHNQFAPEITGNAILHPDLITMKWAGIFLGGCSNGLLTNNIVSHESDQLSTGIALDNTDHTGVYNNNVYVTGNATDSRCFNEEDGSYSNALKNNILANEADGLAIYQSADNTSLVSDYNDFYISGDNLAYNTSFASDLVSWQTTTGGDQHSILANPWFPSLTDLFSRIPLINDVGIPLATVTHDIQGIGRDTSNPDIGAYEFLEAKYELGSDSALCNYTSITLDAGYGYDSYLWNTSAATQTIQTDSVDIDEAWYRVNVTFKGITYTDSLKVTFSGPVVDLADTMAFCLGGSVDITAGDGTDIYAWSTGGTAPAITVSTADLYFVKVTDLQGCIDRDTVTVIESAGPVVVELEANASFCAGDTLTLDPGVGSNYTYEWNDQSIFQTLEVFESGLYTVIVTDQYGCVNGTSTNLTENPLPTVGLGEDQIICDGLTVNLDAGSGFVNYLWSDGSDLQTLNVAESGNYNITVKDDNGCANSDTVTVTVNPPVTVVLSAIDDELQVDFRNGQGYVWYKNDAVYTLGNSYSLVPSASGDYYVVVTDEIGCEGTSNTVSYIITGIEDAARKLYQIYPNPSDGHITIHYQAAFTAMQVIIYNARGNIVYQESGSVKARGVEQFIDLSGISNGVYLIRIEVNGQEFNQKLLIE